MKVTVENTIWWEGADFLKSNKLDVTKYSLQEHLVFDFEKELRITETMTFTISELKTIENIIDIHKYSDLLRLCRITALVKRFCENLKASVTKQNILRSQYLTAQKIRDARKLWIETNQRRLLVNTEYKQVEIQLNCKKDQDGIIRTYGRMRNANLNKEAKFPIMVSKDHHLSVLILMYCHLKVMHRGVKQTFKLIHSGVIG